MNPHDITPWPDGPPAHHKHTKRARRCPKCKYPFSTGLRALCPMCHNCVDCGGYNGFIDDDKCDFCGNEGKIGYSDKQTAPTHLVDQQVQ